MVTETAVRAFPVAEGVVLRVTCPDGVAHLDCTIPEALRIATIIVDAAERGIHDYPDFLRRYVRAARRRNFVRRLFGCP